MSNKGKLNEREWARGLHTFFKSHSRFWYRRWPDHRDWVKINPKLRAPRAPADFVACYKGRFYAMELKSTRGRLFYLGWLKPHQEATLIDIHRAGCDSYLVFMKRGAPIGCVAVPIMEYLEAKRVWMEKGRKSIPVKEMLKLGVTIPRVRGSFDVAPMFDGRRKK